MPSCTATDEQHQKSPKQSLCEAMTRSALKDLSCVWPILGAPRRKGCMAQATRDPRASSSPLGRGCRAGPGKGIPVMMHPAAVAPSAMGPIPALKPSSHLANDTIVPERTHGSQSSQHHLRGRALRRLRPGPRLRRLKLHLHDRNLTVCAATVHAGISNSMTSSSSECQA